MPVFSAICSRLFVGADRIASYTARVPSLRFSIVVSIVVSWVVSIVVSLLVCGDSFRMESCFSLFFGGFWPCVQFGAIGAILARFDFSSYRDCLPFPTRTNTPFRASSPIPKKGAVCSFYGTVGRLKTGSAGRLALSGGRGADGDGTPRGQLPRNLGHAVPL